ncbi:MAG: hypothetical protein EXX96DRAFT_505194 [Benjaminiella poitrasii]|nr:MAG: hypothetical protein EXX96DRAFT_505194 [Benjaminiella poitrasii]
MISITKETTNVTSPYMYGFCLKEDMLSLLTKEKKYPASSSSTTTTPPPSSSSSSFSSSNVSLAVDLAPILNICDSTDNRPPSPDSPEVKKLLIPSDRYEHKQSPPPSFLEPTIRMEVHNQIDIFSLDLFKVIKSNISSIQRPIMYKNRATMPHSTSFAVFHNQHQTHSRHHNHKNNTNNKIPSSSSAYTNDTTMSAIPMSPIMAAASTSAAAAAAHRHPGSQVAKALLQSIDGKRSFDEINDSLLLDIDGEMDIRQDLPLHVPSKKKKKLSFESPLDNVDQNMFLTKNAHIKRPRNAWIHFRCHYGQALKLQDPTLRAEEISKRASRRWGKLSENEKKPWHGLAEQEKIAHRVAFPEYRYCPRRAVSTSTSSPPTDNNRQGPALNKISASLHIQSVFKNPSRTQKRVKRSSK